ncbi:MAG: MaoC family dehydratase [Mameliella sp.]|nr:MaoC family dehydratase [Mameliella sp.]
MRTVDHARDLADLAGTELGKSDWVTITQQMITDFADLTGDDHWIHVDTARAAREMPGGRTIAHGLMVLSLVPGLQRQVFSIRNRGKGQNYGYDRIRFIAPIPVDSRVRLVQSLVEATPHKAGTRIVTEAEIQIENLDRPAIVARNVLLIEDPA